MVWHTARERTESARSGLHFGHSVTQAFSPYLTQLKVMQLNIVLKMGAPLDCWLNCLTVMLKKDKGNINIEKLRAICLFEADLNWVLKVVYAKKRAPLVQLVARFVRTPRGASSKFFTLSDCFVPPDITSFDLMRARVSRRAFRKLRRTSSRTRGKTRMYG